MKWAAAIAFYAFWAFLWFTEVGGYVAIAAVAGLLVVGFLWDWVISPHFRKRSEKFSERPPP